MTYHTLEDYEHILSEIPFEVIEEHLKRRREAAEDFMEGY